MSSIREIQIDFIKATGAPNANLYFRMMISLNDLLNVKQLSSVIDKSGFDRQTVIGLDSYTNRLLQSHIAEACATFVERIRPRAKQKTDPLYLAVQSDQVALDCYKDLMKQMFVLDANGEVTERIAPDGTKHTLLDQYEQLKSVRNQIGFHIDPEPFEKAIQTLKNEYAVNQPVKLIGVLMNNATKEMRFPIADTVVTAASMQQSGIKDLTKVIDEHNVEYVAYRDYTKKLFELLLSYLATTIRNWLYSEMLIVS